jgi:hypothetical protein
MNCDSGWHQVVWRYLAALSTGRVCQKSFSQPPLRGFTLNGVTYGVLALSRQTSTSRLSFHMIPLVECEVWMDCMDQTSPFIRVTYWTQSLLSYRNGNRQFLGCKNDLCNWGTHTMHKLLLNWCFLWFIYENSVWYDFQKFVPLTIL